MGFLLGLVGHEKKGFFEQPLPGDSLGAESHQAQGVPRCQPGHVWLSGEASSRPCLLL